MFAKIDFFSNNVNLFINKRKRIQNVYGGVFSVLFIVSGIILVVLLWMKMNDDYEKNPFVFKEKVYRKEGSVNINEELFKFKVVNDEFDEFSELVMKDLIVIRRIKENKTNFKIVGNELLKLEKCLNNNEFYCVLGDINYNDNDEEYLILEFQNNSTVAQFFVQYEFRYSYFGNDLIAHGSIINRIVTIFQRNSIYFDNLNNFQALSINIETSETFKDNSIFTNNYIKSSTHNYINNKNTISKTSNSNKVILKLNPFVKTYKISCIKIQEIFPFVSICVLLFFFLLKSLHKSIENLYIDFYLVNLFLNEENNSKNQIESNLISPFKNRNMLSIKKENKNIYNLSSKTPQFNLNNSQLINSSISFDKSSKAFHEQHEQENNDNQNNLITIVPNPQKDKLHLLKKEDSISDIIKFSRRNDKAIHDLSTNVNHYSKTQIQNNIGCFSRFLKIIIFQRNNSKNKKYQRIIELNDKIKDLFCVESLIKLLNNENENKKF